MRVSVIIPSYNHRNYVLQAIESVLAQSWPEVDLIVIDDGSTDGSPEVIEDFWKKNRGFRFVRRENRGLIHTLNQGLKMATGECICELASDDYFPSDSIKVRAEFLQKNRDAVAVFADGAIVDREGALVRRGFLDEKRRNVFTRGDPIKKILKGVFPVFSTCLFRKRPFGEIGGFDEACFRYYEDLEAPIRLCQLGRVGFIPYEVIYRRVHDTNVSSTTSHIKVEKVLLYKKLLRDPGMGHYGTLIRRGLYREFFKLARFVYRHPDALDARAEELLNEIWNLGAWKNPRTLVYWALWKLRQGHEDEK